MTLFFHLVWMLCALGTAVFAIAAGSGSSRRAGFGAGFLAGVYLARTGPPDPSLAGGFAAAAVALFLFKPRYAALAAAFGGVLAGLWTALLQAQGLPPLVSPLVVVALIVLSIRLARTKPAFAPQRLLDEGLLAVGAIAIVTLTLPAILDGWQTAVGLSATSPRSAAFDLPSWTTAFILACTSLGGVYSVWSRR